MGKTSLLTAFAKRDTPGIDFKIGAPALNTLLYCGIVEKQITRTLTLNASQEAKITIFDAEGKPVLTFLELLVRFIQQRNQTYTLYRPIRTSGVVLAAIWHFTGNR